eukprot:GHVH01016995.1.p2 GENE.GHVH01016995.1~~GHVH01016995.1.p2  ORF type:complete len:708 (+),score=80.74 GHVH01016995.1:3030-5153(+)
MATPDILQIIHLSVQSSPFVVVKITGCNEAEDFLPVLEQTFPTVPFITVDVQNAKLFLDEYPSVKYPVYRDDPVFVMWRNGEITDTYSGCSKDIMHQNLDILTGVQRPTQWLQPDAHASVCRCVAFVPGTPDSIVSGGGDGMVRLWNYSESSLKLVREWSTHLPCMIYSVDCDGESVWSGDAEGRVMRHDLRSSNSEPMLQLRDTNIDHSQFSIPSNHAHVKPVSTVKLAKRLLNYTHPVLITGSWDATIKLWNGDDGMLLRTLEGHTHASTAVGVRDGKYIVTGCQSGNLKSWNESTKVQELSVHSDIVREIHVVNEYQVVTCSNDGEVKVTEVAEDGTLTDTGIGFRMEESFVYSIAVIKHEEHGYVIACGNECGVFSVRVPSTGVVLGEVDFTNKAAPFCVRSSPDERFISVACSGGILSVWDFRFLALSGSSVAKDAPPESTSIQGPCAETTTKPTSLFPVLTYRSFPDLLSLSKTSATLSETWFPLKTMTMDSHTWGDDAVLQIMESIDSESLSFEALDLLRATMSEKKKLIRSMFISNSQVYENILDTIVKIMVSGESDIKIRVMATRTLVNCFCLEDCDLERSVFMKINDNLVIPPPHVTDSKLLYTSFSALLFNMTVSSLSCSGCNLFTHKTSMIRLVEVLVKSFDEIGASEVVAENLVVVVGNMLSSDCFTQNDFNEIVLDRLQRFDMPSATALVNLI